MTQLKKWDQIENARWDPFRDFEDLHRRLSRALGFEPVRREEGGSLMPASDWAPLVDVTEDDKEYVIKAELPGMKREDVSVRVDQGWLILAGERKAESEEKSKKQHRIERMYGRFERSFLVPDEADPEKICADFKDGLLNVHLPKNPAAKRKSIDVKVT